MRITNASTFSNDDLVRICYLLSSDPAVSTSTLRIDK
jgi:hypothetical protein